MKLKRILSLLMCLAALLACIPAVASSLPGSGTLLPGGSSSIVQLDSVSAGDVKLLTPAGLAYTHGGPQLQDGQLTLHINDSATHWAYAVANSFENMAQFVFQIKPPFTQQQIQDGNIYAVDMIALDPSTAEGDFQDHLRVGTTPAKLNQKRVWSIQRDGSVITSSGVGGESGVTIGTYLPAAGYINPEPSDTVYYLGWYQQVDGVWQLMGNQYETLRVTVNHNRTDAFAVQGPKELPAEYIVADSTAQNVTVEDGSITYTGLEIGEEVETIIKAPAGAVRYVNGSIKASSSGNVPADGVVATYKSGPDADKPVYSSSQCFAFYDAQDKLIDVYTVSLCFEAKENLPWPAYVPGYERVDPNRLIIRNGAAAAGYVQDLTSDHIHFKYDEKAVTPAAAVTGQVEVTILPPDGAYYFRYMDSQKSNNGILGRLFSTTEQGDAKLHEDWPLDYEPGNVEGDNAWLPFYSYEAFRKIQPQDVPKLSIFVPTVQDVPYTAQLLVIHWYDKEMNLIKREYIWETIEPFEIMSKGIIESSEANLPDPPVQVPCIINSNLESIWKNNWEFVVKSYYQQGENARHYEFHIEDNKGNPVDLPADTQLIVYLPFPKEDGFDPYTASYKLRHYSANLYKEPLTNEDGEPLPPVSGDPDLNGVPITVTVTEYGLRLETDSFSPFILSWEEGEPVIAPVEPALPKTGDSTPALLLCALCAASLLTAVIIKRRKHA